MTQVVKYLDDGRGKEEQNRLNFEDRCTPRHNWITGPSTFTISIEPESPVIKMVHHHKKFDDKYTRRERHNNRSKRAIFLHSDLTTPMLTNTAQSDLSEND